MIPFFKSLLIYEEFGIQDKLYITSDSLKFFDQLDPVFFDDNKLPNSFLFKSEYANLKETTYFIAFKFEIQNCTIWQYKEILYNV